MTFRSRRGPMRWAPVGACLVLLLSACAGSRQPRGEVQESGFLGSYADLKPGKKGEAKLLYIDPDADWSRYRAIHLDSVTLWPGKDGSLASLSHEDQQMLANLLYKTTYEALAHDFQMVDQPGPGVLRIRAALTEAKSTNVPLNAVATVVPQIRLLGTAVGLAANTAATVGKARVEVEVQDSLSGRRLAAAVDERVGQRSLRAFGKWSQVEAAFDHWAQRLDQRLVELRDGKTGS